MKEVTLWKMFVLTAGQNPNLRSVGWPGTDHYTDYTGFQHFVCLWKKKSARPKWTVIENLKKLKISSCWIIEKEIFILFFTNIQSQDHSRWNPQHLRHDETIHCINTLCCPSTWHCKQSPHISGTQVQLLLHSGLQKYTWSTWLKAIGIKTNNHLSHTCVRGCVHCCVSKWVSACVCVCWKW